jgi:Tol biopolymer transport system component
LAARLSTMWILVLASLAMAVPAHAAFPGANGKIAFVSSRGPVGIYTMNADGSNQTDLTTQVNGTTDSAPAWSPDGHQIAFARAFSDVANAIFVMNEDGSNQVMRINAAANNRDPTWSPDGQRIAFARNGNNGSGVFVMNKDGTGVTQLTATAARDPNWSPDGTRIVFRSGSGISLINADGANEHVLVADTFGDHLHHPSWSPDGSKIIVTLNTCSHASCCQFGCDQGSFYTLNPETGARTQMDSLSGNQPVFAPDGTRVAYMQETGQPFAGISNEEIFAANLDGTGVTRLTTNNAPDGSGPADSQPDWQPITYAGYPRPKGATPTRDSLVPAYQSCSSANSTHGSPLAFPSCAPPVQASGRLTVGTPPQESANSVGAVTARVITGDVQFGVSITDVRNQGSLSDYSGELEARLPLRVTDRDAGVAATTQDFPFSFAVPCAATTDTTVGSTCSVVTTADTLVPGAVTTGLRTIWALGQIGVYDGGSDGSASTTADNIPFMDQGIFVP